MTRGRPAPAGVWSPARGAPMRPAIGPDGVWLRANRLGRRLTQAELADRAGVSKEAIHTIERGRKHPHASTLALLARALATTAPRPNTRHPVRRGTGAQVGPRRRAVPGAGALSRTPWDGAPSHADEHRLMLPLVPLEGRC